MAQEHQDIATFLDFEYKGSLIPEKATWMLCSARVIWEENGLHGEAWTPFKHNGIYQLEFIQGLNYNESPGWCLVSPGGKEKHVNDGSFREEVDDGSWVPCKKAGCTVIGSTRSGLFRAHGQDVHGDKTSCYMLGCNASFGSLERRDSHVKNLHATSWRSIDDMPRHIGDGNTYHGWLSPRDRDILSNTLNGVLATRSVSKLGYIVKCRVTIRANAFSQKLSLPEGEMAQYLEGRSIVWMEELGEEHRANDGDVGSAV